MPRERYGASPAAARRAIDRISDGRGHAVAAQRITDEFGEEVTRFQVHRWSRDGVAARWVWRVAQLSGIPAAELDPVQFPPEEGGQHSAGEAGQNPVAR